MDWPELDRGPDTVSYCVYDHPLDFPDKYVVRRWASFGGELFVDVVPRLADTLEEARSHVPPGLTVFPRREGEDLSILETWL